MINIRMQNKDVQKLSPKITVIGVGGAGSNAVNNMIGAGLQGVEFIVCNTDAQSLDGSLCETRLQLGVAVTGGLGAGARPEVGRSAAQESLEDIMQYLEGSNMAFITAGMGGGTGTGAAPVIAKACREKGILTVGVVTKPFHFEGTLRMRMAEAGIEEMQNYVDTLIVIPNQNLFRIANERTTFTEAFRLADSVLQSGVRGVTDLMVMPGHINLDFADIRSAMLEMGKAMMGTGEATGDRRAIEASEKAINNPLLDDVSMKGARGVIINVTGGYDMTLFEVDEACNRIRDEVDPNANIIFGSTFDESLEGIMRVSVVATGIDVVEQKVRKTPGITVNTVTAQQQQRPVERPVTAAAPVSQHIESLAGTPPVLSSAVTAGMYSSASAIQARTVAARAAYQQQTPLAVQQATAAASVSAYGSAPSASGSLAYKLEEEQVIVPNYIQQELVISEAASQAAPQEVQQEQGMRGAVYNDSFIPPMPIEPEPQRDRDAMSGYSQGGLSASRLNNEVPMQPLSGAGLSLKPPIPASAAQPKKRTPSLFERFTSPLRHHERDEAEQQEDTDGNAGEGDSSSFHARQKPLQGSLNIDAPKATDLDDELDIPAFLRRQAN